MVVCLHVNSIKQLDMFDTEVALFKQNMYYKRYGSQIVQHAIKDSPFEGLAPLVSNYTAFIFSAEIKTTALESILKKNKKLLVIGGVLEGQVMKLDDFRRYGEMDITTAQSYLVQTLQNAAGGNLNRQLTYHQSMLLTRLNQIGTIETTSDDKK
ncbi:PREDICTED: 39S ribosomal protein L10, mitochondrial-like [Eufriesea mexicana]|uniref:39S ribosomal protein L10, mitochondrial-like n=1 Tax=Eufriesea mexicana TaxID=516756 RepID=UPI00083C686A|nr:PREDICTED: 39S ribosomal protein L10, mitochondrial-like [Eufriesea mexicana]